MVFILDSVLWGLGFQIYSKGVKMKEKINVTAISEKIRQISQEFYALDKRINIFSDTHQVIREDVENEGAFYNNIDFFYGLFFERCDVYRNYIMQKIQLYRLNYDNVKIAMELLHDLRTYKSHTLNRMKPHDKVIIQNVEKWYFKILGKKQLSIEDVGMCSIELNILVNTIITSFLKCADCIKADSRKTIIIEEMLLIKEGYCPDYYIETLFGQVMKALDFQADAHTLSKKYASSIREKIKIYQTLKKEERESKIKLRIEEILFYEKLGICPLSAKEIMEKFGLKPGKELGDLKRKAIVLAHENPYITKDELLECLILIVNNQEDECS